MNTPGMRCAVALQEIGIGITQDTEQLASFIDEKIGRSAQEEPVSDVVIRQGLPTLLRDSDIKPSDERLYTRPPAREWVGLTDEELKPLCAENHIIFGAYTVDFIHAIEAKLKEKNT